MTHKVSESSEWLEADGCGGFASGTSALVRTRRYHGLLIWRPYHSVPAIVSRSNAVYVHQPDWYRQFLYSAEVERGLDSLEDLASSSILEPRENTACGSRGERT
jgi:hypothetical protein